jgi:hypothetical protein
VRLRAMMGMYTLNNDVQMNTSSAGGS